MKERTSMRGSVVVNEFHARVYWSRAHYTQLVLFLDALPSLEYRFGARMRHLNCNGLNDSIIEK